MKNIDKPYLNYGKAMFSIEIVSDSLDAGKNFHELDKCQAASFWLKESVFTLSEFKMNLPDDNLKQNDSENIVSINT